jgi:uncharacterized SAM-binding protein YcdF (DUF218 family)
LAGHATIRQPRRQAPVRRARHRRPVARRKFLSVRTRLILSALALVTILLMWAIFARAFAPKGNTALLRFDAIIVLGSPADSEGNPSPSQLARVTEAVREYERGVAPRLILSGGPARNQFVEAQVMARTAQAQGVPDSAILIEPVARDTIQNACYSVRIMKEHGWHSAEVVSAAGHLARAGLIFSRMPIEWRTHAAPALEPRTSNMTFLEVLKTARYLIYADWAERCAP